MKLIPFLLFKVELLRTSYANQVGRFRDYRAAQIENVNQHIESIRDNYNQQVIFLNLYFRFLSKMKAFY